MIVENSPVDNGLSEGGGGDQCRLLYPIAHAPRVNSTYIPYIARDTQRSIYTSSHAWEKSRSLESANDTKTGEQSVLSEIHTNHAFGMS